nr:restriction endonuclease subunit S [Halomonas meridiana]
MSQSEGLASTYASGDVLFGKLRPYLAKIYLADTPGLVSSEALVIRPSRDISSSFLKYYFLSRDFINTVDSSTYGSKMPRASWNYIGNLPLLIPSAQEQQAIVDFLNHKTAQIDALIAKKQSLLDKLAEQRTALISQAVTKGLDPSVPMKDSGVDWLGKIPKYWHVSKLGYVAKSLQTGPFGSQLHADEYVEDGTPLINPSDISKGKITGNPTITVEDAVVARLSRHKLELGDIVIARRGEMGRAGLVGKGNVGWLCGTGSLRARLKKEVINPEFLLYQFSMRGVSEYLSLQSVGSTMDNLNTSILGRLWVVVPPLHEQNDIISEIQKVSSRIEKMRSSVTSAISKLQEYRSALITNAVTGKIDVRDFCIPTTTVQKEVAHG